jgi:Spy/CpxP family protein refolding chaperone
MKQIIIRHVAMVLALTVSGATLLSSAWAANEPSPYAGLEGRGVKGLSADEARGLIAGEGMAQSLPAELNGYPGPRHVRQHADALGLNAEQRDRAAALEADMQQQAETLGREVVGLEDALDRLFQDGRADPAAVERLTNEIGHKRGALRAVHLRAHVAMAQALSADQRARYMALRGYGASDGANKAPPSGHHRHD